ncbi:MAG: hypothetical protein KFF73_06855 [Cyclobacteriaceae bacterium]|nr:hypothetical protein [Cyclobacteriaceae bacterium]
MKRTFFHLFILITILSSLYCFVPLKKDTGFLRVDQNGRYFVFDDGTPYIPIGFNKFRLYLDDEPAIDSLLNLWSSYGVNYLRVWMGGGSEPEFPVGTFNEERMKRIDYIISKCEEYGIYLSLCFWDENTLRTDVSYGWNSERMAYNKSIDPGGTTDNPEDLKGVEHTRSWEAINNRYKVFVDRWNGHKNIMMWDLANDCKKTYAWKAQIYELVREWDPNDHIIGFQYYTGRDPKGEMDCGSVRVYDYNPEGNDPEEMTKALFDRVQEALQHGDPVYCGEGRMHYAQGTPYELERFYLHTLWGPIATGAAGNLHAWVCRTTEGRWPDYSLQELQWMKQYSAFCQTIDWAAFNSKNMNDAVSSINENVLTYACGDENQMLLYLVHDDPEHRFEPVSTILKIAAGPEKPPTRINWIDIRTGKVIKSMEIRSFPAEVEVPAFRDGIFAHLK